jgi:hypothetical protein
MGWFSRNPKPQITDPVFGALELQAPGGWIGEVTSPIDRQRVMLSVVRKLGPPNEEDRRTFQELYDNFSTLVPSLRGELFRLWVPELEVGSWDETAPRTPEGLWDMLQLESLMIFPDSKIRLGFAFVGEFWPDAMFSVDVQHLQVKGISLDD